MTESHLPDRSLAQFYLDGVKDALHPAERQLLECAAIGEICVIADERPEEKSASNLIRSPFLRFLLLGGGEHLLYAIPA